MSASIATVARDVANSGYLFPAKKTAPDDPDFKGKIRIRGAEIEIRAWTRTTNGCRHFVIEAVNPPQLRLL